MAYKIYDLTLRFIFVVLNIPLIHGNKYTSWLNGQRNIFSQIKKNKKKTIWLHCASMGEYEQIKPLLIHIKKQNPRIILTFFSPSGFENFQDHNLVYQVSYLPLDTKNNMIHFIDTINPQMVIVSKNDIWPNMIKCIHNNKIPLFLVGVKLKKSKIIRWINRQFYIRHFGLFSYIFCQDDITYNFLNTNNIKTCMQIGDLRAEQMIKEKSNIIKNQMISSFVKNKPTIIYGSLETNDYDIIIDFIKKRKDVNHIVVPHELKNSKMNDFVNKLQEEYFYYSKTSHKNIPEKNILIIDTFGLLKHAYRYSLITYVGGGFDQGVHNTVEPAIYGNQIIFGPKHKDFPETFLFIEKEIAQVVNNKNQFEILINKYLDKRNNNNLDKLSLFIKNNSQVSSIVVNKINEMIKF